MNGQEQRRKERNRALLLDGLKKGQGVDYFYGVSDDEGMARWSIHLVASSEKDGSFYKVTTHYGYGEPNQIECSCKWGRSDVPGGWRVNDLTALPCRHMLIVHFLNMDPQRQARLVGADPALAEAVAIWKVRSEEPKAGAPEQAPLEDDKKMRNLVAQGAVLMTEAAL